MKGKCYACALVIFVVYWLLMIIGAVYDSNIVISLAMIFGFVGWLAFLSATVEGKCK